MKTTIVTGLLILALLASGAAPAQNRVDQGKVGAAQTVSGAPVTPSTTGPASTPNVESIDILKQNQAERSRDQPGNAAPTFRIIKEGTKNYSSLPALESGVLIQPKAQFPLQARATTAGEAWRNYRNGPLTHFGGWILLGVLAALAAMYFIAGPVRLKSPRTGRLIERFTAIERLAHWSTAITFVLLALSGLTMLFGKYIMIPVFGHPLFGWLAFLCKNVHNFVGPLFTVSIVVTFIVFVKDNFPGRGDLTWLLRLGGMFGGKHAHAGRFNAGEKLWFWGGVVGLSLLVSASGFVLDKLVPGLEYSRGNMQIANVIHLVGAVLVAAMSLGHIYLGSIGMEGALEAMTTGYVDDEWAREHHDLWYDDVVSGKVPRIRTVPLADTVRADPGPASAPS
ncbi:MAG: formate dehydrogenase subunit gamma [Herminiimonas sp.]|nr:formate dehydrogenase subunit gamma [Herminiimonas sp.]